MDDYRLEFWVIEKPIPVFIKGSKTVFRAFVYIPEKGIFGIWSGYGDNTSPRFTTASGEALEILFGDKGIIAYEFQIREYFRGSQQDTRYISYPPFSAIYDKLNDPILVEKVRALVSIHNL